jgi:uncharacterized protein DUF5681
MTEDEGPPDGGTSNRPMWEALNAELRRQVEVQVEVQAEHGEGRRTELLQVIAAKLAAKAADGDLGAIKEIFDRMDGRAVAGSAPEQGPRKVLFEWKDPE